MFVRERFGRTPRERNGPSPGIQARLRIGTSVAPVVGMRWRRLVRHVCSLLPRSIRDPLVRRQCHFDASLTAEIEVTLATTRADYAEASRLVHDAYVGRGWLKSQDNGRWVASHQALPEATTIILRRRGKTVGTVAIVEDSPVGLPIDDTFGETAALRRPGRRFAELSTLALAQNERASGLGLLLMICAWRYAKHVLHVTDLLIAVDEPVAEYYEALFDFHRYTPTRSYAGFPSQHRARGEDPVVGLHQDVLTLPAWARQSWPAPPEGRDNPATWAMARFPHGFEIYPVLPESRIMAARAKLPRSVFREFFAPHRLGEDVLRYLAQWRSRQTIADPEEVAG